MCGIVGFVNMKGQPVSPEILKKMTESLTHRGPDAEGMYTGQLPWPCALGHRRLSIIDVSAKANQPMMNKSKELILVFNGEIYNFKELRRDLESKGYFFTTRSDTETVLIGYEAYGSDIFSRLNGMFAIAILDINRKELVLARDRYGQKPLYYAIMQDTFIFASELKALLLHPSLPHSISANALSRYFFFEHLPSGTSIIENAVKLPPGEYLRFNGKKIQTCKYFKPDFTPIKTTYRDAFTHTETLLRQAVSRHFIADVPVGVFLSGGIDSSLITAVAASVYGPKSIEAFSIGFEEKSFDESAFARTVAAHTGVRHYIEILSSKDILSFLPKAVSLLDEPFADASFVPTSFLSQFARRRVTVALGGDAGDELFAGYDPFLAHRFTKFFDMLPETLRRMLPLLAEHIPVSHRNMSVDFIIKQFLRGMEGSGAYRNQLWLAAFTPDEHKDLFSPEFFSTITPPCASEYFPQEILSMLPGSTAQIIWAYLRYYLSEGILTKVDRASMLHSLEVRAPFLDTEFSDYVNHLPSSFKLHGLTRKYLLKKIAEKYLPHEVIYRKKKGFGMPIGSWLRGPLRGYLCETLDTHCIKKHGIFNSVTVQKIIDEHLNNKRDNRKQLWALLVFQSWMNKWL